jgi:hypothetical protein
MQGPSPRPWTVCKATPQQKLDRALSTVGAALENPQPQFEGCTSGYHCSWYRSRGTLQPAATSWPQLVTLWAPASMQLCQRKPKGASPKSRLHTPVQLTCAKGMLADLAYYPNSVQHAGMFSALGCGTPAQPPLALPPTPCNCWLPLQLRASAPPCLLQHAAPGGGGDASAGTLQQCAAATSAVAAPATATTPAAAAPTLAAAATPRPIEDSATGGSARPTVDVHGGAAAPTLRRQHLPWHGRPSPSSCFSTNGCLQASWPPWTD